MSIVRVEISTLLELMPYRGETLSFSNRFCEIVHKVTVVALYAFIGFLHLLEIPLAILTCNITRMHLHITCMRIAFTSLHQFTRPLDHPHRQRFDFHHLSYGLALILLVGPSHEFGKWMTFDSLVNYDHLGTFGYRQGFHFAPDRTFRRMRAGESSDGTLARVSRVNNSQNIFPADNFFVDNWKDFVKEWFFIKKPKLTSLVKEHKNHVLNALVLPALESLRGNPAWTHKPIISIDFKLFA